MLEAEYRIMVEAEIQAYAVQLCITVQVELQYVHYGNLNKPEGSEPAPGRCGTSMRRDLRMPGLMTGAAT